MNIYIYIIVYIYPLPLPGKGGEGEEKGECIDRVGIYPGETDKIETD